MDRNNSIYSPTLTVIPLTSVKPNVDYSKLHISKLPIGNEVYTLLTSNFNAEIRSAKQHLKEIQDLFDNLTCADDEKLLNERLKEIYAQISYCKKMKNEADHMKQGSIALVGQIVTISKIRIYDPKYNNDALSKVRISAATLDLLDKKVQELYGSPVSTK